MDWAQFNRAAQIALLGWLGTAGCRAATVPTSATSVALTIDTQLSELHPNVTHGALDCGVVAQSGAWVSEHLAGLTDNYQARRWVLGPAHYYGQEALLEFPVVNRAFSGSLTFQSAVPEVLLTDPATHARWAPAPTLLVVCWLLLNGRPALWDRTSAPLVVTAENFASVGQSPLATATREVAGGAPVSLSASLVARGNYFVPEPVNLFASITVGASSPQRSTARQAASSSRGGSPASSPTPPAGISAVASTAPPPAAYSADVLTSVKTAPGQTSPVRGFPGASAATQSAKAAGIWNSIVAIVVAIVEAVVAVITTAGGTVSAADQADLQESLVLEETAAAAVCTTAMITIIQEVPTLLDVTPVQLVYVYDPVYAPLTGPPILVVQAPMAAPLAFPAARPGRLTRQQIEAVIQSLPTNGSAPKTTAKLRTLLQTITPRS